MGWPSFRKEDLWESQTRAALIYGEYGIVIGITADRLHQGRRRNHSSSGDRISSGHSISTQQYAYRHHGSIIAATVSATICLVSFSCEVS
jgi:hypothetical protein